MEDNGKGEGKCRAATNQMVNTGIVRGGEYGRGNVLSSDSGERKGHKPPPCGK